MARVPLITSKDQVPAKDQAVVELIIASRGSLQGPFTVFLHCPELAGRLAHLGAFVRFEGSLDMRVRVLAAMTVAREFEAQYRLGRPDRQRAAAAGCRNDDHRDPGKPLERCAGRGCPDHRCHTATAAPASAGRHDRRGVAQAVR